MRAARLLLCLLSSFFLREVKSFSSRTLLSAGRKYFSPSLFVRRREVSISLKKSLASSSLSSSSSPSLFSSLFSSVGGRQEAEAMALQRVSDQPNDLHRFQLLHALRGSPRLRDRYLFQRLLVSAGPRLLPLLYTPTVGSACLSWSRLKLPPGADGVYLSEEDRGKMKKALMKRTLSLSSSSALSTSNSEKIKKKVVVVTDGERILGLGDLGRNGMGIPIGKSVLYTACAGLHPEECLPVHIDVGTNNPSLLADPSYQGLKKQRIRGKEYDSLIEEFVDACQDLFGKEVLIQFEDFSNVNAFRLLEKFSQRGSVFNDDIQGTAAVVLSGLLTSMKAMKEGRRKLADQTYLFYGAGSAGVGVADLLSYAMVLESNGEITLNDARKRIWLVDSQGLVTSDRNVTTTQPHKLPYMHSLKVGTTGKKSSISLEDAIDFVRPTAILGMSAQPGSFTESICRKMACLNERPIIFALSNPTSKSECTATEAYHWTNGSCIFASGSPFSDLIYQNKTIRPGQCNNAYIFPAIGLVARAMGLTDITTEDFYNAAVALSKTVSQQQLLESGSLFPSFQDIRDVSFKIAVFVGEKIAASNRTFMKRSENLSVEELCRRVLYFPSHPSVD